MLEDTFPSGVQILKKKNLFVMTLFRHDRMFMERATEQALHWAVSDGGRDGESSLLSAVVMDFKTSCDVYALINDH